MKRNSFSVFFFIKKLLMEYWLQLKARQDWWQNCESTVLK